MTPSRSPFEPVVRRTVSDEVRDALADSMRTGVLPPGSQLPSERALCEEFGVARTSVREAMQGLVSVGIIEKRGNRSYVAEHLPDIKLDGEDRRKRRVHELFEVRQVVEAPIAKLATSRAAADERAHISELADQFHPTMPLEEFRRLDRAFHWTVAQACGNATLAELYGKVLESLFQSPEFEQLLGATSNRDVVLDIIGDSGSAHRSIAAAIAAKDPDETVASVERHLAYVEDQMISRMV